PLGTEVPPQWGLPRAIGPAGLIHARAVDLLAFARLHLADGVTVDGQRVLSATTGRRSGRPPTCRSSLVLCRWRSRYSPTATTPSRSTVSSSPNCSPSTPASPCRRP